MHPAELVCQITHINTMLARKRDIVIDHQISLLGYASWVHRRSDTGHPPWSGSRLIGRSAEDVEVSTTVTVSPRAVTTSLPSDVKAM